MNFLNKLPTDHDWKTNLSLYFQFCNPFSLTEETKIHINTLKEHYKIKFSSYEDIFLEILTHEKAYSALEKMNFLFPKYLNSYFYDLLFEYRALLPETIEKFENRTLQEQNIVEFLKFAVISKEIDISSVAPFMVKLRALDANRSGEVPNLGELMNSHENLLANVILTKFCEDFDEEKVKEFFELIEKMQLQEDFTVKQKILQVFFVGFAILGVLLRD